LIILKFDFAKTYEKIDWEFVFMALEDMGMVNNFLEMVKLLFKGVELVI
jgi:hypothetical protein